MPLGFGYTHGPYRPKCCGCSGSSVGRICYAGKSDNVIDNPFCNKCYNEVVKQTSKLIKELYSGLKADYILIQRWDEKQVVPSMPFTLTSLYNEGIRVK
jgi:hypothetical protein